jgi:hypothetical protein
MEISTITGKLLFKCPICAEQVNGDAYDVRMPSVFHASDESTELWINIIKNAPHDRVSQLVDKECKNCKRSYMTRLRLGNNETIIYSCKCGYNTSTDKYQVEKSTTASNTEHKLNL